MRREAKGAGSMQEGMCVNGEEVVRPKAMLWCSSKGWPNQQMKNGTLAGRRELCDSPQGCCSLNRGGVLREMVTGIG